MCASALAFVRARVRERERARERASERQRGAERGRETARLSYRSGLPLREQHVAPLSRSPHFLPYFAADKLLRQAASPRAMRGDSAMQELQ